MGFCVVKEINPSSRIVHQPCCYDVVVVGAGTVGMAVALALHQAHFSVALVDHHPRDMFALDHGSSKWFALGADNLAWFQQLGFNLSYQPITHLALSCQNQERKIILNAAEAQEDFLTGVIGNQILHTTGRALCQKIHGFFSNTLTHWQDQNRVWQLELSHGQVLETPLVIAADGGHSGVRAFFNPVVARWDFQQKAVVFRLHGVPTGWSYEHFFPKGSLAVLSMEQGQGAGIWIGPDDETEDNILSMVHQELGIDARISDVSGRFEVKGHWVDQTLFHRCVLIGDAALAIHPIAGQGLNLGLRHGRLLVHHMIERRRLGLDWGLGLGSLRHSWGIPNMSMQLGTWALVGALCGKEASWWWSLGSTIMEQSWARTWLMHTAGGKMIQKNPLTHWFTGLFNL